MIFLLISFMCLVAVIAVALESLVDTWLTLCSTTSGAIVDREDLRRAFRPTLGDTGRKGSTGLRRKEKEEFDLDEKENRARQFRRNRHRSGRLPKDSCWDSARKSEG